MAHELGHFLYHSNLIGDGVDDNRAYRSAPEGAFYNRLIGPAEETQANRFAAGILMPKERVLQHWQRTQDLTELSKLFQVSKPAMRIRLEGLGIRAQE